jgi:hypothetical protein
MLCLSEWASEEEEDFKAFQDGMCGVSTRVYENFFVLCVSQNGVRATMVCVVLSFSKKELVDDVKKLIKNNQWFNGNSQKKI